MQALSSDGRCKTLSNDADGYARGEGCGLVVLKRLSDVDTRTERVLAIIKGTASAHDGKTNGLTAPNPKIQQQVLQTALLNSGIRRTEVQPTISLP